MIQYFERNRWLTTLIVLVVFLTVPVMATTFGAGFTLPGWLRLAVSLVACLVIGVQVMMTDTLSAKIFRFLIILCAAGFLMFWFVRGW
ncbi:hypothetical protein [Candidatus Pantoea formicae]|uniref:hypothetical protein n=1 Tax=Candidatus Pantoea formicae TaxID=2608355 RepID=UPI003EDA2268